MIPEINSRLDELDFVSDASISIGTIEDFNRQKELNDIVAMSVSIKTNNEPVVIKIDRKGELTKI